MANLIERNAITEKLNKIFKGRFGINLFSEILNVDLDDNLLKTKFGLRARDLLYLVNDLEHEFGISINDEDINDITFTTIRNILRVIEKETATTLI